MRLTAAGVFLRRNVMYKNFIAEFIGTMFLILVAVGSTILAGSVFNAPIYIIVLTNAISVAFVLFALIEMFSPISGSHFNPAVTIALFIAGEFSKKKTLIYICAQLSGAMFGILITHLFFWDVNPVLLTISSKPVNFSQVISEFFCTFILIGSVISLVRGKSKYTSLVIGMLVGGMIITSSSNMYANPAVTLARVFTYAVCEISPKSALIYIFIEILGALSALKIFSILYPLKLETKCNPFDCSVKGIK